MEQMLEALAKARRAQFGDDPKIPNPMRARLHEEITRAGMTEGDNGESRPSWITMFWPRMTVAAALATLLVLIPAIWWNQSHPSARRGDLALRDRTAASAAEFNAAVPAKDTAANASAVSASDATVNLADNSQVKIEPGAAPSSESEAVKSPTSLAQGRGVTELRSQQKKEFDTKIASAKIQAAPGAVPPAGAESKAKSDTMTAAVPPVSQPSSADGLATTQQFFQQSAGQSFRNNAQVSVGANVLNTFQVQQEGNEIRVLDADGSTYTGKIEQSVKGAELDSRIAAQREVAKQTPRFAAKAVGENKPAIPQSYFRATGYNVSLKKTLVFEGSYAAPAPQQPTMATTNDRQRTEQIRERARIFGIVLVNGEAPVEVDAIAFTPEATETKKNEK
jgi:hypothetical protein